jgi:hypothetical protein
MSWKIHCTTLESTITNRCHRRRFETKEPYHYKDTVAPVTAHTSIKL